MKKLQHSTLYNRLKIRPTDRLLSKKWRCNAFGLISLGLLTLSLFGQPAYAGGPLIQPPDQQTPDQLIIGSNTGLDTPKTIARDSHGNIYVNNEGLSITVYAPDATGDSTPLRTLNIPGSTASYGYYTHNGIAIDVQNNLYVCDNDTIKVFAEGAYGDIGSATAPISRSITLITQSSDSCSIGLDSIGNIYALVQKGSESIVYVFGPEQSGDASPLRTITNHAEGTSPGFAVDMAGTVFLSTSYSPFTSIPASIYSYAPGAQDDVTTNPPTSATPNSVISGAHTGLHAPIGIALDNLGNIHVTDNDPLFALGFPGAAAPSIRVFAAGANGDVAAIRTIGDSSHLSMPIGLTVDKNGNIYVTDNGHNSVNSYLRNVAPTPCGPGVGYQTGTLMEFSLPCVPTSSNVLDVLGTGSLPNLDSSAYIEWDWKTWDYGPGSWLLLGDFFDYNFFPRFNDMNIRADSGYLFASDVLAPVNNLLKVAGTSTLTDATPAEGCASKFGCKRLIVQYDPSVYIFSIPRRTFNHLGNPFPFTVGLNSVRFVVKNSAGAITGVYTPSQAAQMASSGNAPKALLPSNEFFIWDGVANTWFDFSDSGPNQGSLGYMKGFWFLLLNGNYKTEQIELLIPNEATQK